ncbi:MAG: hypothetical protein H7A55_19685 [Verrucomicrobiaceae bacterium]|nr:hypothetical protein [Verrucomicrobiaceae bacterium]
MHDDLDAAVFAAYGWPATLTDAEILERLVALNAQRAAEEARGIIHWLRPDYQQAGTKSPTQGALDLPTQKKQAQVHPHCPRLHRQAAPWAQATRRPLPAPSKPPSTPQAIPSPPRNSPPNSPEPNPQTSKRS